MHQRGFGLIELLMGLTVAGIVLLLVTPAFAALTESTRREEAARSLLSGIRNARTLAIDRNQAVVIYAINGDWGQGWRIMLDISGKGLEDPDNPVVVEHASGSLVPIAGNLWVKRYIRLSSLGAPMMGKQSFRSGTLHICAAREPTSHFQVVLAVTGRVSLRRDKAEQALCKSDGGLQQRTDA